ncbi:MAG: hypothetical protein JO112_23035, partial [Planctomycetes bacterium]|nr:hypothetical protein [Planctomycetota bacterium]
MEREWPFEDPPNVAVFTLTKILHDGQPILLVAHDEDDGAWQFLDGDEVRAEEAALVSLKTIVTLDQTVAELADLPCGWIAWRQQADQPWQR